jgi:hypothetical protein
MMTAIVTAQMWLLQNGVWVLALVWLAVAAEGLLLALAHGRAKPLVWGVAAQFIGFAVTRTFAFALITLAGESPSIPFYFICTALSLLYSVASAVLVGLYLAVNA